MSQNRSPEHGAQRSAKKRKYSYDLKEHLYSTKWIRN